MISENELRIGNLLYWQDPKAGMIIAINWRHLKEISENPHQFNAYYSGIQITEKILRKYGFEEDPRTWEGKQGRYFTFPNPAKRTVGIFQIRLFRNSCQIEYLVNENFSKQIVGCVYLHQMQNQYFYLIGRELEAYPSQPNEKINP